MIYRVRHTTSYTYGHPVELAAHILHLTPRDCPGQTVLRTHLECAPAPVRRETGVDHFGNRIVWLFHEAPHSHFDIVALSDVDVYFPEPPPADSTLAWEDVALLAAQDPDVSQYLFGGPMGGPSRIVGDYVSGDFAPGRPVLEGLLALNERVQGIPFPIRCHNLTYDAGRSSSAPGRRVSGFHAPHAQRTALAGAACSLYVGLYPYEAAGRTEAKTGS